MTIEQDVPKMPQPSSRRVRIEEVDGELELSYRRRPWFASFVTMHLLAAWSIAGVHAVGQVFAAPGAKSVLFALFVVAAWSISFYALMWMLFGMERVRLGIDGLEYQTTALVPLTRRTIPREELKGVSASAVEYKVGALGKLSRFEPCLKFETRGRPIEFAQGISEEEQRWLVERLKEYLEYARLNCLRDRKTDGMIP